MMTKMVYMKGLCHVCLSSNVEITVKDHLTLC